MIDPSELLSVLPATLRDELVESFQTIMTNYLERRWGPTELDGGKFCEVVYSIIHGAIKGHYPARSSKPDRMLAACQALEREPADPTRVGDRSMRVLIPRLLPVLYEIRSNRGVGHVGGDVNPNHMDAEAVQGMASWVMAELVRIFHGLTTQKAETAVDAIVERKSPLIWDLGNGVKRVLDPKLGMGDQVLVLLHHSTGPVSWTDLFKWTEYSNNTVFRASVLMPLHKARHIEFDTAKGLVHISPLGIERVEQELLRQSGTAAKRGKRRGAKS